MAKKPQLTGPDYLVGLADQAAERGQPYADDFREMVMLAFSDEDFLVAAAIARRELREHEASPVSIVYGAAQAAISNGDPEAFAEVMQVGLSLLAKWPDYLVMLERHPDLAYQPD